MIFVDTSAWVALFVRQDEFHGQAASFWDGLRRKSVTPLSSFDVFGETLTVIRGRAGLDQALEFGEAFLNSRILIREEVDGALRQKAWALFKQYHDKPLSFTDCTSFALLRKRGINLVFSFDEDFRRLGFSVNILP
ncbi:MAG: PIN domain-containing protein [Elusimicrobia bacterium]|nr:PIN domain-containing protein [Elusimicrobiota bacterium]